MAGDFCDTEGPGEWWHQDFLPTKEISVLTNLFNKTLTKELKILFVTCWRCPHPKMGVCLQANPPYLCHTPKKTNLTSCHRKCLTTLTSKSKRERKASVTNGDIITITNGDIITITVTSHPGRDLSSASWVPASPSNLYHSSWTNRIYKTQNHNKRWMSLPRL